MSSREARSNSRNTAVGRTNSKTGCQTCKIRRVKCDEDKPSCRRCTSTGRRCEYAALPHSRTLGCVTIQSSPFSPTSSHTERRSFEYYFYRAGPSIAGVLDVDFWKGFVLQICRSEPAVWDAVIAASIFYESPPNQLLGYGPFWKTALQKLDFRRLNSPPSYLHALRSYSRSLETVQARIQQGRIDLRVALVSCTLYICIETLLGHTSGAIELYKKGIKLLETAISRRQCGSGLNFNFLEEIMSIYIRLGSVAYITAGVPFELRAPPLNLQPCFISLSSARTSLIRLVSECLSYESAVANHIQKFGSTQIEALSIARMHALQSKLELWRRGFELITNQKETEGPRSTLLMMYHAVYILVCSSLRKQELEYDRFLDSFRSIVQHGEAAVPATTDLCGSEPHFTFEIGVGMPLLVTALKCRESSTRRKALTLLRRCPPTQRFYLVSHGSALVEKAIEIEEALNCDPANPDPLEETKRLQYVSVYPHEQEFSLLAARKQKLGSTGQDGLHLVEERVSLSTRIPYSG